MWKRSRGVLALSVVVMLVSAACSVSSIDDSPLPSPGTGSESGAGEVSFHNGETASSDGVINVELSEFAVELSQTEFEAGVEYVFRVTNAGVVAHEMMLIAPHENSTTMEMELHDEMAVAVFEVDDLQPGATVEQTVVFPTSGDAELEAACFVAGHYEAGMKTNITVTG